MKPFKTVLFVCFLFLSVNTISAQYGNGYGGNGYGGGSGYGGNSYGRSNQMGQMSQSSQQSAPKPIPAEVTAAKIVEYYKKELSLDALQEVVLTNIYTKSLKKQDALIKKESSDEDKEKEFKVLGEMTDLEVMQILNKEQKAKYQILSEDRKNKIESRKH
jgi:Spy/CpxP family protein refolding chaperone